MLSCYVDERAAIKIRAVVFRPDGQKLTGAQLKEQCARRQEQCFGPGGHKLRDGDYSGVFEAAFGCLRVLESRALRYASFLTELDVTGAVEVKPLKDSATPYTSTQRLLADKRIVSKELLEELESTKASNGSAFQL